ncbi:iron superoxide dismutase [Tritrichomonas foetus]|uniref:Superoxide dismutase n=3 Tax=Tritrichomonas TaxID=5723 RepID=A0A1J4J8N5_9EUKA|nr:superoxide dismutase 1 [Tritrichomonas foetus]OHS94607.1 iron superoxide dismutase [Tritrichomonas foetus]|eukprot:OHS94607.1 iron superoxide dismutase [Tritrichomonas foetus]
MFSIAPIPYMETGISGFLTKHAVEIHVTKHHQAYVDFANKNVPGTEFEGKPIEEIIQKATGPLFNNVAQHFNHAFFWNCLTAKKQEVPAGVASFLAKHFESVDNFKAQFVQKASTVFGSGWCYLAQNKDKTISINQYSNALNPVKDGGVPLLCVDTWEHAWYIDYENRKAEYFNKFWDACNWEFLEKNLKAAGLI